MPTLSLSGLRQDPRSEPVEVGRRGHALACGRCFIGKPLTAGEVDLRRTIKTRVPRHMCTVSNRPDLFGFLLFDADADAGSSPNMVSSQTPAWPPDFV